MAEQDRIIASIAKNDREEIRVTVGTFNGRSIFGARVWFRGDDGQMRPGKSGIAFKIELLDQFAQAVTKAAGDVK